MKSVFKLVCSCGRYATAWDFTQVETAIAAACTHRLLNGEHKVAIMRKQGCIISLEKIVKD